MDFFEVAKTRRSVRAFKPQDVESAKIEKLLGATNSAPSAGDLQAYEIVVVRDPKCRSMLMRACNEQEFVGEAPLSLVFVANPGRSLRKYGQRGNELYCVQDATIACAYAQLTATALGLASTWVGAFDDDAVRKCVGASADLRPVAVLPIGYPNEQPEPTPRRRVRDLAHDEELGNPHTSTQ